MAFVANSDKCNWAWWMLYWIIAVSATAFELGYQPLACLSPIRGSTEMRRRKVFFVIGSSTTVHSSNLLSKPVNCSPVRLPSGQPRSLLSYWLTGKSCGTP